MRIVLFLCISMIFSSVLYAESAEKVSEEVALLEPSIFTNPPIEPEKLGPPPLIVERPHKSSFVAVGLSFLAPGLGSIYLGDYAAGVGLLGTYSLGRGLELSKYPEFSLPQNTVFYGIYAAYRDVRIYNNGVGYSYKMPTDSLADLTRAPFRWKVLKKPEVWGALLGSLYLGGTIAYYAFPKDAIIGCDASKVSNLASPIRAFPVGIGEEAFFRGYLQSFLAERTSPEGGMVLSSILFGLAHAKNAGALKPEHQWRYYAFSIPYISAMGGYFSWLTYKNGSLQESVALHSWYDFTLFSLGALATQAAIGGNPNFNFSFVF